MLEIKNDQLTSVAPGVFYTDAGLVAVDDSIITFLKKSALEAPLKRARLCAHPDPDAVQQDMVIVSHRDTYVPPHRHRGKTETLLVIEGRAQALLFDEHGTITKAMPMGPQESGRLFFYRMPEMQYHSLLIEDEWLVFAESTMGPFSAHSSQNASWAPAPTDRKQGAVFKKYMERQAKNLNKSRSNGKDLTAISVQHDPSD